MQKALQSLLLSIAFAGGCSSPAQKSAAPAPPAPQPEPQSMPALLIKPAPEPAPAPAAQGDARAERLAALAKEQKEAMDAYFKALDEALKGNQNPSREELDKIRETVKEPDTTGCYARAQQLLDEDLKDITAFNTLRWMLENARDADSTRTSLGLLEKYHFQRPEMGDMCSQIAQSDSAMLDRLAANSPHAEVRGRALYTKAEGLRTDLQRAESIKGTDPKNFEWLGADKLAALQALDPAQTQKQMEQIYQRLANEFAEVKLYPGTKRETTLGKRATAGLYEIHNLSVGQVTPEIEGTDLDSVAFKLSEYRGKVVLLDFWGFW